MKINGKINSFDNKGVDDVNNVCASSNVMFLNDSYKGIGNLWKHWHGITVSSNI